MKVSNGINLVKLKIESKNPLLMRVWYSIELIPIQPCVLGIGYLWPRWWVSLAELLLLKVCLWISIMCRDARVLWLLWQLGVAQWRAQGLGGDLGACPVSSSRGLRIIGPMRALVSPSDSILVSLSNTSLSMYFFCNSRIHVITLYLGHVCVVLCVNASMLVPRMNPD
jgi:hypothetical protein